LASGEVPRVQSAGPALVVGGDGTAVAENGRITLPASFAPTKGRSPFATPIRRSVTTSSSRAGTVQALNRLQARSAARGRPEPDLGTA
jgi:hypothetical protein